jgi:hypothetical protein
MKRTITAEAKRRREQTKGAKRRERRAAAIAAAIERDRLEMEFREIVGG